MTNPNKVFIDFETYSEINLKTAGLHRYAMDPSTEVQCLAYAFNDDEPEIWIAGDDPPKDLILAITMSYEVHAHNAGFEQAIWHYVCHKRMGWINLDINRLRDTMALCAIFAIPQALDKAGEALNLDIIKDKRGKHLINKLCKPRKPSKKNPDTRWTPETAPDDYYDFYEYCKQDVRAERAIHYALPWQRLKWGEQEIWKMNLITNNRGLPIDIKSVNSIVAMLNVYEDRLTQELGKITSKRIITIAKKYEDNLHSFPQELISLIEKPIETIGQRDKILDFCKLNEYPLPDLTAPTIKDHLDGDNNIPKDVRRVLELRQTLAKTSTKKFIKIQNAICEDNRVRDNTGYHVATTGRYGGRNLQPQNLPRASVEDPELALDLINRYDLDTVEMFYENPMWLGSALVRPSICAPPGKKFNVSDYSSIENRMIHWLAEDEETLESFRKDLDQYKDMATTLYNVDYDDVEYEQRRHGKLTVLGAGYQMGAKKFRITCEGQGYVISQEEAKFSIDSYREKYPLIVALWYGLDRAAKQAIVSKRVMKYKRIRFALHKDFLFMILPSGRMLAYYKPQIDNELMPWGKRSPVITHMGFDSNKQWRRVKLTPGRNTENASQATCRDLMVQAMLRVERAGYKVLLTVHDEIVCEVNEDFGSLEGYNELMTQLDESVYPGFPLAASGYEAKRYKKG